MVRPLHAGRQVCPSCALWTGAWLRLLHGFTRLEAKPASSRGQPLAGWQKTTHRGLTLKGYAPLGL